MRRILFASCASVALAVGASSCNDDGRTLRPAGPEQDQSISTIAAPTTLAGEVVGTAGVLPAETSPAALSAPWRDGAEIDSRYTCDGADVSPALIWGTAPAGTVEIAVSLIDLDVPDVVHWVMAGLDPARTTLAEGEVPAGAIQATNSFGVVGYSGPCNEPGSVDRYRFTVHFLSQQMELGDAAAGADLRLAVESATFSSSQVIGLYSRP
jgi:Raf kinase inhibitor-like YbhB/YbcL family protein